MFAVPSTRHVTCTWWNATHRSCLTLLHGHGLICRIVIFVSTGSSGPKWELPSELQGFLENCAHFWAGNNVRGDCSRLGSQYGVKISADNCDDLSILAQTVPVLHTEHPARWRLDDLCLRVLGVALNKDDTLRVTGRWEDATLSQAQVEYAADDAAVSRDLHVALTATPPTLLGKQSPVPIADRGADIRAAIKHAEDVENVRRESAARSTTQNAALVMLHSSDDIISVDSVPRRTRSATLRAALQSVEATSTRGGTSTNGSSSAPEQHTSTPGLASVAQRAAPLIVTCTDFYEPLMAASAGAADGRIAQLSTSCPNWDEIVGLVRSANVELEAKRNGFCLDTTLAVAVTLGHSVIRQEQHCIGVFARLAGYMDENVFSMDAVTAIHARQTRASTSDPEQMLILDMFQKQGTIQTAAKAWLDNRASEFMRLMEHSSGSTVHPPNALPMESIAEVPASSPGPDHETNSSGLLPPNPFPAPEFAQIVIDCCTKMDPEHILLRYERGCVSMEDPLFGSFMHYLAKALFQDNAEDREKLVKWLTKHRGLDETKIKALRAKYWYQRLRRHIPPPLELARRLSAVVDMFAVLLMANGVPLFRLKLSSKRGRETMTDIHYKIIKHALKGCISDPPGMDMYLDVVGAQALSHADGGGPPKRITVRGTSQLEGFHHHLERNSSGHSVGPATANAQLLPFIVNWNIRSDIKHRGMHDFGFHNLWIIDEIQEQEAALFGVVPYHDSWVRTPTLAELGMRASDLEVFGCGNVFESQLRPHIVRPDSASRSAARLSPVSESGSESRDSDGSDLDSDASSSGDELDIDLDPDAVVDDDTMACRSKRRARRVVCDAASVGVTETQAADFRKRLSAVSTARLSAADWLKRAESLPATVASVETFAEGDLFYELLPTFLEKAKGKKTLDWQAFLEAFNSRVQATISGGTPLKVRFTTVSGLRAFADRMQHRYLIKESMSSHKEQFKQLLTFLNVPFAELESVGVGVGARAGPGAGVGVQAVPAVAVAMGAGAGAGAGAAGAGVLMPGGASSLLPEVNDSLRELEWEAAERNRLESDRLKRARTESTSASMTASGASDGECHGCIGNSARPSVAAVVKHVAENWDGGISSCRNKPAEVLKEVQKILPDAKKPTVKSALQRL